MELHPDWVFESNIICSETALLEGKSGHFCVIRKTTQSIMQLLKIERIGLGCHNESHQNVPKRKRDNGSNIREDC